MNTLTDILTLLVGGIEGILRHQSPFIGCFLLDHLESVWRQPTLLASLRPPDPLWGGACNLVGLGVDVAFSPGRSQMGRCLRHRLPWFHPAVHRRDIQPTHAGIDILSLINWLDAPCPG